VFVYTPVSIQDWGQVGTLNAGSPQAGEQFGYALALFGDTLAVGAPGNSGLAPGAGAVHLFVYTQTLGLRAPVDWGQVGTLNAGAEGSAGDAFGSAVGLFENTLVVGAPFEDGGPGNPITDTGAAYVFQFTAQGFEAQDWGQVGTLNAGPGAGVGDAFGSAVSVSGLSILVSAPFEDGGPTDPVTDTGAVYVFGYLDLVQAAAAWEMGPVLRSPEAQPGDRFGNQVALDGVTAAVGAPYEDGGPTNPITDTGAAYIFDLITPNTAPMATDDERRILPDCGAVVIDVLANDRDVNGDHLTIVALSAPEHGTAQIQGLTIVYTPAPGFRGVDTFGYTITDGNGGYAVGAVIVTVEYYRVTLPFLQRGQ
jgi:hypothetical protein